MESTKVGTHSLAPPPIIRQLTVAVCTNRVANLQRWRNNDFSRRQDVHLLVVVDCAPDHTETELLTSLTSMGAQCLVVGENRGLATARNLALSQIETEFVLFADDDVTVTATAIDAVLASFARGADLVGAWLVLPPDFPALPWFIGPGHMHYLGIHNQTTGEQPCWGAFFGIRAKFANAARLKFRQELGRKGSSLECGDDSQFAADAKTAGGMITFLSGIEILHHIDPNRISLRYLLRRAYWQGISESRRCRCCAGLAKEFRRLARIPAKQLPSVLSSGVCVFAVLSGMIAGKCAMFYHLWIAKVDTASTNTRPPDEDRL